jgi:hypothetical protein
LSIDHLRSHRVEQVAHAVGFEKERELEGVGRHVDPVVRAIVGRRAVVRAAGPLEQRIELARLHVARAHEHQMLEEMREPGAPGALARRADVIPDVDRDNRHAMVFVQDDVEAVRKREVRVRQLERLRRSGWLRSR